MVGEAAAYMSLKAQILASYRDRTLLWLVLCLFWTLDELPIYLFFVAFDDAEPKKMILGIERFQ